MSMPSSSALVETTARTVALAQAALDLAPRGSADSRRDSRESTSAAPGGP